MHVSYYHTFDILVATSIIDSSTTELFAVILLVCT